MESKCLVEQFIEEGEAYFKSRADRDIEQNRKGFFKLFLKDETGANITSDAVVTLTQDTHEFDFGCNIFMLGQYEEEAKNEKYCDLWRRIFNTAVVPLYWEGTEPVKGQLRYHSGSRNNIYRRPPVDMVVDYCLKNAIRMKGHPLFWHEFVPEWLPDDFAEIKPYIVKRFREISEKYAEVIPCFDVVNEPSRIWDVHQRDKDRVKHLVPDDDYCTWLFRLAEREFPSSELLLNDAVRASFCEFRGKYGGYYLTAKDLIQRGLKIDRIGLQCHLGSDDFFRNVYDPERLYDMLDTYETLGRPLVISEISVPSVFQDVENLELQTRAVETLYKVFFSHRAVNGIFWWNLTDDGILSAKRVAAGENIPTTGLIDIKYQEKPAYLALDRLINNEWRTNLTFNLDKDTPIEFRAFYGSYTIQATVGEKTISKTVSLGRKSSSSIVLCV